MTANFMFTPIENLSQLTYPVLIEQEQGNYKAMVLGLPDCQTRGKTREAALVSLRQLLEARLENAELVSLDIERPQSDNPWIKLAGKYKDDPQFDQMLDSIQAYRRELDQEMEDYYRKLDAEDEVK
jgi:predicted RNase H-like HicB family nuclease